MGYAARMDRERMTARADGVLSAPCKIGTCWTDWSKFNPVRHTCWRHDVARRHTIACRLEMWRRWLARRSA